MEKANVFIYGTCQSGAIGKFLKESTPFNEMFNITEGVLSYVMINDNMLDWSDSNQNIREADVFLYQPVSDAYGKNASNYLKTLLKPGCRTISVPYVYNTATFPFLVIMKRDVSEDWANKAGDRREYLNKEVVDELIHKGHHKADILRLYDYGQIDFQFDRRWREGMKLTNAKEAHLDVKVHDFIMENISKKKLFMYCSHPTSVLLLYMANQVLTILGLPVLPDSFPMDFAGITGFGIPNEMPTCSNNYFKFEFNTPQGEAAANSYYRYLITEYLDIMRIR
jgi:hypothetical protein